MSANNYHVSLLPFICIMHSVMVAAVIHEKHCGHKSLYHICLKFYIKPFRLSRWFEFSCQNHTFRYLMRPFLFCNHCAKCKSRVELWIWKGGRFHFRFHYISYIGKVFDSHHRQSGKVEHSLNEKLFLVWLIYKSLRVFLRIFISQMCQNYWLFHHLCMIIMRREEQALWQ